MELYFVYTTDIFFFLLRSSTVEKDLGPPGSQWGLTRPLACTWLLVFSAHRFELVYWKVSRLDPRHLRSPTMPRLDPRSQRKIVKGMRMPVVLTATLKALRRARRYSGHICGKREHFPLHGSESSIFAKMPSQSFNCSVIFWMFSFSGTLPWKTCRGLCLKIILNWHSGRWYWIRNAKS